MSDKYWLLSVTARVEPDEETSFNHWYDNIHIPVIVKVPGVHSARRFVADGADGRRYVTNYEIDSPAVLQSPEFAEAGKNTAFTGKATFDLNVLQPVQK
jgi:antibiotic biosynthesis monooxygenase (ABM) superfamily enzyme